MKSDPSEDALTCDFEGAAVQQHHQRLCRGTAHSGGAFNGAVQSGEHLQSSPTAVLLVKNDSVYKYLLFLGHERSWYEGLRQGTFEVKEERALKQN